MKAMTRFTIAVLSACALTVMGAEYAGWSVGAPRNGYGTILRTIDSGVTWFRQGSGQVANVMLAGVFTVSATDAWVVGDADAGYATIYHTTDGGATWPREGFGQSALQNISLGKVHASSNY